MKMKFKYYCLSEYNGITSAGMLGLFGSTCCIHLRVGKQVYPERGSFFSRVYLFIPSSVLRQLHRFFKPSSSQSAI